MSFGDRLFSEGVIPPQLIEDANVIEDIFPKFVDDEIDKVQDLIDYREHIFSEPNPSPTKRQKTSTDMVSYQRRKRSPITVSSLHSMKNKLNKVACCNNVEKHSYTEDFSSAIADGGLMSIDLFNGIDRGSNGQNRYGDKIKVKSVSIIMERPLKANNTVAPLDIFLVKPLDTDTAPILADFTGGSHPACIYSHQAGTTLRHLKYLNSNVPFWNLNKYWKRPMTVTYVSTVVRGNHIYFCVKNAVGETITVRGTIKIDFYP